VSIVVPYTPTPAAMMYDSTVINATGKPRVNVLFTVITATDASTTLIIIVFSLVKYNGSFALILFFNSMICN